VREFHAVDGSRSAIASGAIFAFATRDDTRIVLGVACRSSTSCAASATAGASLATAIGADGGSARPGAGEASLWQLATTAIATIQAGLICERYSRFAASLREAADDDMYPSQRIWCAALQTFMTSDTTYIR